MRYFVTVDGREHELLISSAPDGGTRIGFVRPDGVDWSDAELEQVGAAFVLRLGTEVLELGMSGARGELEVFHRGRHHDLRVESEAARALRRTQTGAAASTQGRVVSPMPGKVVEVLVAAGDDVRAGQTVVVVEAMKMQNPLTVAIDGKVLRVLAAAGDTVERGATLVEVEPS